MKTTEKIPYKIYLSEDEMPKNWYNVRADMKVKPAPLLNPGTGEPTDPGAADPGTTDPGTTDPGTTDPGTTEPDITTDPVTPPESGGETPQTTPEPPTEPENPDFIIMEPQPAA